MALNGKAIEIGTGDTVVYTAPATLEASLHGIVFGNVTSGADTITLKLYKQSLGTTITVVVDQAVAANATFTWPKPVNVVSGDQLIASAGSASTIVALYSVFENSAQPIAKGFTPRGEWSSGADYVINDVAEEDGTSYIALQASTSASPKQPSASPAYWMINAEKGDAGGIPEADLNGSGFQLVDWVLNDTAFAWDDDGTISGGTWAIDYANGPTFRAQAGANITSITIANWPPSGKKGIIEAELVNFGAYTITFPAWLWVKSDLTTTTTFADLGLALPSSGTATLALRTSDGGTTVYATILRN